MQGQAARADGGDESGEASFPRARASQPVSPVPAPIACPGKIECPPEPASASHSFPAAQGWNIEAAGRPLLRLANPGATNFSRAEGNGERSPSAARPHRGLTTRAQRCIIMLSRRYGGIGRHKGLKILRKKFRIGSSPISGTMPDFVAKAGIFVAMPCAAKALRPCRKQSPARKRRHTGDRPDMRKTGKATSAQRPVITASPSWDAFCATALRLAGSVPGGFTQGPERRARPPQTKPAQKSHGVSAVANGSELRTCNRDDARDGSSFPRAWRHAFRCRSPSPHRRRAWIPPRRAG